MRKVFAWLGAATLMVLCSTYAHAAGTALKPYVVLILDTSGSMNQATGSGPPSCGGTDSKINHARCAINKIVNSYGDMVFAFGKFREAPSGTFATNCATDCTTTLNVDCSTCNTGNTNSCTLAQASDNNFQLLTSLQDLNNSQTATYTDFQCNSCAEPFGPQIGGTNPEIMFANSWTPLNGAFRGDKRYWLGLQASDGTVIWPNALPGFNPIVNDPTNTQFLPAGSGCDPSPTCTVNCCTQQCRPYITILLTDGDETCSFIDNNWPTVGNVATTFNIVASPNGASKAGTTATFNTTAAHPFSVGDIVIVKGVGLAGYNGTWTVASVPSTTRFTATLPAGALANSGGGTVGFAPGLLATDVVTGAVPSLKRYRIETHPIGFGTPAPYAQIENIAKAGGAVSIPGQNMGYYASDEAGLELAISTIIEKSLRTEVCNNLDDDCDGLIDEDFPTKGNACTNGQQGVCAVAGTLVCRADGTGVTCNAGTAPCTGQPDGHACTVTDTSAIVVNGTCTAGVCNPTPQATCPGGKTCNPDGTEVCGDNLDNDCDGAIDEGCAICVPTAETCNNKDDDCDGLIDENITRQCPITNAFGTCLGSQTCTAGVFSACAGQTPTAEVCNNLDDDCDGIVDENLTRTCSNILGNGCNTSPCPGSNNPNMGICHPGTEQCTNGAYGACTGEQVPQAEICNGLDDDCDGIIDEGTGGGACTTTCGVGTVVCLKATDMPQDCGGAGQPPCGTLQCNAQPSTGDYTCNNIDDDCDGKIDEDWKCSDPSNNSSPAVPCACGAGVVCNGVNKCINGAVTCVGDPVQQETCNCVDDDCDGKVDEDVTCANGGSCVNCQCALPCNGGEFPCPQAKKCTAGFCVNDPCYGVTCPPVGGNKQVCVDNGNNTSSCMDACSVTTCNPADVCIPTTGQCKPNDCTTFPDRCTAQQNCVVDPNTGMGQCVGNPCTGVTCPSNQYCELGQCYGSCSGVTCPSGQRCRLGTCQADPCGHPCPAGEACNDNTGQCINNPCGFGRQCPQGEWCNPNDGQCESDPCVGTMCPTTSQVCVGGTCYDPSMFQPDAGMETHVTVGGGGCTTGGGSGGGAGLLLGVLAFVARRRGGRS